MLVSLCLQLLKRVMELVMLSLFCGSSAAFLAIALSLLRLVMVTYDVLMLLSYLQSNRS